MAKREVPISIQAMRAELLEMLVKFDAYCARYGIAYSVLAGTLLGTVRHRGYIPWDDDIDVGVPRPDLNALIARADDFKRQTGLELQGFLGVPLDIAPLVKVVNPNIRVKTRNEAGKRYLWIDISPFDGLPADDTCLREHFEEIQMLQRAYKTLGSTVASGRDLRKRCIKLLVAPLRPVKPIRMLVASRLSTLAQKYPFGSTPYVGSVSWGLSGVRERVPADLFVQYETMQFEGHPIPVMGCWDQYLVQTYGKDYMIPPEGDQHPHVLQAYRLER